MNTHGRAFKIVPSLPIKSLDIDEENVALRRRDLRLMELKDMLRNGPVEFVIAEVGRALRWIPVDECYNFWKAEVKAHIAEKGAYLDQFPNAYCYFASDWGSNRTGTQLSPLRNIIDYDYAVICSAEARTAPEATRRMCEH